MKKVIMNSCNYFKETIWLEIRFMICIHVINKKTKIAFYG